MRNDSEEFRALNLKKSKEPRYAVGIDFGGTITYITSHSGITGLPGTPIENAITKISAVSQTLNPDRANSTIGTMSFSFVDLQNAFTDLVRTNLGSDIGLRGQQVTFHLGYKDLDFSDFVLFQTQIVQNVQTKEGFYKIDCADIQRSTKKQIFEREVTYLTNDISDTDTTIQVLNLSGFEGLVHGTSYTDGPGLEVIYIEIEQTGEIIRCPVSGISGNSFTGVTRARFGSRAKAVDVDSTAPSDRRPKVLEYIYLELPAPKMIYSILTGVIHGTANVLPSGWHAGVPTSLVRLSDFTGIGIDLWDTTDDTAAVVLRFDGIGKQDAKRFIETEIFMLLGLYSPVYADGSLGLKRMVPAFDDSPYLLELNDQNVIGTGSLRHDMESLHNSFRIDWNFSGGRFIRSTIFTDSTSIARHKLALQKRLGFRGLSGSRFTEGVISQLITSLRDMYTGPPLRLDVDGFHMLNPVEIGDPLRVNLTNLRDFTNTQASLQRTMVVHGMSVDMQSGVKLKLFGSSERLSETAPTGATSVLPAGFYAQAGTALSSIPGLLTGNVTNAGTFTLAGNVDVNAVGAIFFHDDDLTISSTTTIIIENNVQLRVGGFLTVNGAIEGIAEGLSGGTDSGVLGDPLIGQPENLGNEGFIGNSWPHHNLRYDILPFVHPVNPVAQQFPTFVFRGRFDAFPNLIIAVDATGNGSISGIPADMRGTGGPAGGRMVNRILPSQPTVRVRALGGDGGQGGSGLLIVSRGGDFGASGVINLSGGDGIENNTPFVAEGFNWFAGTGGAGGPGSLLWLLDGALVTFPDILGKFIALTGEVQVDFPMEHQLKQLVLGTDPINVEAYIDTTQRISEFDHANTNFRIQFLPEDVTAEEDQDSLIIAPSGLTALGIVDGVQLSWTNPTQQIFDHVEIHASDDDEVANALFIGSTPSNEFFEKIIDLYRNRYYWIRSIGTDGTVSDFFPATSTTTAIAAPLISSDSLVKDPDFDLSDGLAGINDQLNHFWWEDSIVTDGGVAGVGTGASLIIGTGRNGSNVVKLQHGDEPNVGAPPPFVRKRLWFVSSRRFRSNIPEFTIKIFWRNNGANTLHDLVIGVRGYAVPIGGTSLAADAEIQDYAVTGTTWQALTLQVSPSTVDGAQYWEMYCTFDTTNDLLAAEVEIDSIFIYSTPGKFGTVLSGKTIPGLVPLAEAAESGLFLKGDGTWDTPTGSGVDSFATRTGAVVPIVGDYDAFFLTPAEGDAAYSMLGHSHTLADISDSGALAALDELSKLNVIAGQVNIEAVSAGNNAVFGSGVGSSPPVPGDNIFSFFSFENSDDTVVLGKVGIDTGGWLTFRNDIRGGQIRLQTVNAAGALRTAFSSDPDGDTAMNHRGGEILRSIAATAGGVEVNNTSTGAGFERVLTVSDIGGAVDSFNSRTGAVLPILADYDSFFLTPAEGDAAYSMLGHSHVEADITNGSLLARLADTEIITALWQFDNGVIFDNLGVSGVRFQDTSGAVGFDIDVSSSRVNFLRDGISAFRFNERLEVTSPAGGVAFKVFDSAFADSINFEHTGVHAKQSFFQTTNFELGEGLTGDIILKSALRLRADGVLALLERAADAADLAGYGQFWVLNSTPNEPYFTDDVGVLQLIDPSRSLVNVQNGNYTLLIGDKGKTIHKVSGGAGETWTIPANASVAYKIGTLIAFQNEGGGDLSIAITSDTLTGTDGSTGTKILGDDNTAVIQKMTATSWKYAASDL